MAVLVLDAVTAEIYGRIKHELKIKGFQMPDNDLWIAATAMQYDIVLAARDTVSGWAVGVADASAMPGRSSARPALKGLSSHEPTPMTYPQVV